MDVGFFVRLDRQWRANVVAITKTKVAEGSFELYDEMSEDTIRRMVEALLAKVGEPPFALSINAGAWARSKAFHIKAIVTPDRFCAMRRAGGKRPPSAQERADLERRHSEVIVDQVANGFSSNPTKVVFDIRGIQCERLDNTVRRNYPYLKLSPAKKPIEFKQAIETFEKEWFVGKTNDKEGFAIYMIPASENGEWDLFINIDPGQYKRIFPDAITTSAAFHYEPPQRTYQKRWDMTIVSQHRIAHQQNLQVLWLELSLL